LEIHVHNKDKLNNLLDEALLTLNK